MTDLASELQHGLDEMVAATDRLLMTVDGMGDEALRQASLLPDWTRAHVLTHVARNADGLANLAHWARTGEETPMYPGGPEQRDTDIEAGAGRHIGDIRLDLADSAERLLQAFADFPAEGLEREVVMRGGNTVTGWELPFLRLREVEIHHVDLGLGYSPADWSEAFAIRTLDQVAPLFREARECPVSVLEDTATGRCWRVAAEGPRLSGAPRDLAAWLVGRTPAAALELHPSGPIPAAPRWT